MVLWGQGADARHVPDIWILHIHTMSWKEVQLVQISNTNASS